MQIGGEDHFVFYLIEWVDVGISFVAEAYWQRSFYDECSNRLRVRVFAGDRIDPLERYVGQINAKSARRRSAEYIPGVEFCVQDAGIIAGKMGALNYGVPLRRAPRLNAADDPRLISEDAASMILGTTCQRLCQITQGYLGRMEIDGLAYYLLCEIDELRMRQQRDSAPVCTDGMF